jgi:hypothetical protein
MADRKWLFKDAPWAGVEYVGCQHIHLWARLMERGNQQKNTYFKPGFHPYKWVFAWLSLACATFSRRLMALI